MSVSGAGGVSHGDCGKAAWQSAGLRSARRSQERATEKAGCLGLELQLQAPCTQNATPQKRWARELLTKVCLLLVGAPALAVYPSTCVGT